jgi:hypothetical protein
MEAVVEIVAMGCAALQVLTISRINTIRPTFHTEIQSHTFNVIQGDSAGKINILRGDNIGHCEKKSLHMNMCLILNCFRDTSV